MRTRGGFPGVPAQAGTEVETPRKDKIIINGPPDIALSCPPDFLLWLWWTRPNIRACLGQGCSNPKVVRGDVSCLPVLQWAVMDQNLLTCLFNIPLKPKTHSWQLWGYKNEGWPLGTFSAPAFGALSPLALTLLHPRPHPCTLCVPDTPQDGLRQYIFIWSRCNADRQKDTCPVFLLGLLFSFFMILRIFFKIAPIFIALSTIQIFLQAA